MYLDESPISIALFTPDLELLTWSASRCCAVRRARTVRGGLEAGTVRYITRQPQLGKFEAFTDGSVESVARGCGRLWPAASTYLPR